MQPVDPYLSVEVISQSPNPQKAAYADMHQCYSEEAVAGEFFGEMECYDVVGSRGSFLIDYTHEDVVWIDPFNSQLELTEYEAGIRVIEHCLKQKHWGVIESPSIHFAFAGFPHSVMQQARTHRIGVHFGVQSGRYTSKRIIDVVEGKRSVEEVFYTRPSGFYDDRKGKKYEYTEQQRQADLEFFKSCCSRYKEKVDSGFSEEHARGICIPYDIRQHFTASFNIRSLFHFLDMRTPKDAQLEIRQMCELMWPHVVNWIPQFAEFYYEKRWSKNQLAP